VIESFAARGEKMKLSKYFKTSKGYGVLATADAQDRVNVAVYAKPHIINDEMIAFIVTDRYLHQNVQANPCTA
jgi:hypothetical protein